MSRLFFVFFPILGCLILVSACGDDPETTWKKPEPKIEKIGEKEFRFSIIDGKDRNDNKPCAGVYSASTFAAACKLLRDEEFNKQSDTSKCDNRELRKEIFEKSGCEGKF